MALFSKSHPQYIPPTFIWRQAKGWLSKMMGITALIALSSGVNLFLGTALATSSTPAPVPHTVTLTQTEDFRALSAQPAAAVNSCTAYRDFVVKSPTFPLIVDWDSHSCPPALWTRQVIGAYVFKALGALNYVAGALCVILTILAGILYMLGFSSENNLKKAKSILLGTYIGFLIVLFARVAIGASLLVFNPTPSITDNLESLK